MHYLFCIPQKLAHWSIVLCEVLKRWRARQLALAACSIRQSTLKLFDSLVEKTKILNLMLKFFKNSKIKLHLEIFLAIFCFILKYLRSTIKSFSA